MKYVVLIARLLIGGLFIYASVHKIFDPGDFAQAIRNYQILPPQFSNLAAMALPWIEMTVGVFLVVGVQTRSSAVVTTSLMAVFVVALFYVYWIGLDISCGCFTSAQDSGGKVTLLTLVRDTMLFLVSLLIVVADRGNFALWPERRAATEGNC